MPLEQVIACATSVPAPAIGRPDLGTLAVRKPADLAIFRIANEPAVMWDTHYVRRMWDRRLKGEATLRAGVVYRPEELELETEEAITRRCRQRGRRRIELGSLSQARFSPEERACNRVNVSSEQEMLIISGTATVNIASSTPAGAWAAFLSLWSYASIPG